MIERCLECGADVDLGDDADARIERTTRKRASRRVTTVSVNGEVVHRCRRPLRPDERM